MKLLHKRAIVTGAAAGIGRAIAARFAAEGAAVACIDIDAPQLERTVREVQEVGNGRVIGVSADVGIASQATAATHAALDRLGGVDILVNNAGINSSGTLETLDLETWNRTLAVNLTSMYVISKAVWPHFARQRHGTIINMSSIMGLSGASNNFAYCACKAAIIALTKSLAADGGPLGIRVNCVCPGFVHTAIMDRAHSPQSQARINAQLPMKRMATAEEVAAGFLYLASDEASYTSGAVLVIDGAATVGFAGYFV